MQKDGLCRSRHSILPLLTISYKVQQAYPLHHRSIAYGQENVEESQRPSSLRLKKSRTQWISYLFPTEYGQNCLTWTTCRIYLFISSVWHLYSALMMESTKISGKEQLHGGHSGKLNHFCTSGRESLVLHTISSMVRVRAHALHHLLGQVKTGAGVGTRMRRVLIVQFVDAHAIKLSHCYRCSPFCGPKPLGFLSGGPSNERQ